MKNIDEYKFNPIEEIEDYAIFLLDKEGNIKSWNKGAKKIKGYSKEEVISRHYRMFYTSNDQQAKLPETLLEEASRKGKVKSEGWRTGKNLNPYWASDIITAIHDDDTNVIGFIKISRNQTEGERVVDSAPSAMLSINREGKITMVNRQAEILFGYTRDELINKSVELLIPPRFKDNHSEFQDYFFNAPKTRLIGMGGELFSIRKNGTEFPVEIGLNPIESSEGMLILATIIDITERKKAEERFRLVVESAPNAMVLVNEEGKITLVNSETEKLFGYNRNELIGTDVAMLIPARFRNQHADYRSTFFIKPQAGPMGKGKGLFALRKDATEFPAEIKLNPLESPEGNMVLASIIDISERRKYESELQQNQILLNRVYDIAEMGYWTYNPDINYSNWNEQAKRIFGLLGHIDTGFEGYLSTIHHEDLKRVKETVTLTLSNNKPYDLEYRIVRPADGEIRWIHERTDFVPNNENSRLLLGVVQDITVRKKVEEILLEYNQRYEILSRATNDAIWDLDIENDFELWNHGIQSIFGYSTTHIKSAKQWRKDKIHSDDYDRVQREITNTFNNHRTNWTSQYRYLCANGNYKYVLDRAYIIYNENKPARMIGAMQDITEQREFEQHIIATARELSELIENANTPIFGTDRNGYINEWNKVTASLTGYLKNEVLGKKLSHYVSPTQHKNLKIILNRVSINKPVSDLQIPIRTKDNRELTILLNATPRRDTLKNITGILMVGQNITELIEYRQNLEVKVNERTLELNEALSKEKELVEIKSKFVSIASHEFRTPLSTIAIVVGFLRKHRAKLNDDDFNLKLNSIEKQVNHMTYLLDDILMIGKTEAGKITAQHNLISIKDFFLQIAKEVEESAKTHTVDVKLMCSVVEFNSDEKLLRNIIINLLTNAIKFSPNAQYVIFSISNTTQYLRLTVEDKGIGISEEDLKNIFTSFHRGSNVGDIQGTGLGLSIAKKAVDLLHGTIQINSKMGEGTQFTVNLPLQQL